ncbi:MAG: HAD family phosphatase [Kiritimatiellae bacterium]|nr:HAD family phosphatase [Kiritimatiellia bacterium]
MKSRVLSQVKSLVPEPVKKLVPEPVRKLEKFVKVPALRKGWAAAFLFDLDGTLIDSEMLWAQALVGFLADRGASASVERVAEIVFGHSWLDIQQTIHQEFPQIPAASAAEDAAQLRPYYARLATDPAKLVIPSSVAFFKKVAKLAPCAIVSGSPHDDVLAAAETCGIAHLIEFVLGAEDYGRGKPAPDSFLKAAEMLDVDASECVVIEDSSAGVRAGRAAGMHVLGLDRNPSIRQDFAGCDWLVHDLAEINVEAVFGEQ